MISFKDWNKLETNNLGYSDKTHWFKFNLNEKNIDSNLKYFLVYQNHQLEEVDLFIVKDKMILSQFKSGLKRVINNQEIKSRKHIFPLPNEPNIEIFVKVKNSFYPINIDSIIPNNYTLETFLDIDKYILNIIYSLFFILLLVHILIYKLTKIDFYKYYLIYLFLIIIVGLFNSGILNLYIFKDGINNLTIVIFKLLGFIMIVYLIKLIQFTLNLEVEKKKINKYIKSLILLLFLCTTFADIFSLFDYIIPFFIYLSHIVFIILCLLILSILVLESFKNDFISKILILIWLPLFITIILNILKDYNSFINYVSFEYLIKFIFIYESIFISIIIAYKYNLIEKEKEQLIIESKNKEIEYLRKSKLIKMGEMLNNIAHQWKQPLARINSIVFKSYDLIDENKKGDLKNELLLIENETLNMSNTISSLLSFFHIDKKEEKFNLYDLVINQKEFIKRFDNSINFEINCSDNTISTNGYKKEYEQVIRVILENAIDSFEEFNIQTKKIIITIKKENDIPILSIENIGKNINEEFLDKIFEPYFTTKNKNEHQGIGLYMSKMLIEESMNKKLRVSNTNLGVEFIIEG